MTRILHVIGSANPTSGGPIEGTVRTGIEWARHGHQQDIATLDAPGSDFWPDYPGQIFNLGDRVRRGLLGRYHFSRGARKWLREAAGNYDAVLVSGLWNYSTMASRLALVGEGRPYFVFTHGMLDPWFSRTYPAKAMLKQLFWLFNEGVLLRHAAGVLFTTEEERRLADRAFRPYRVRGAVVGYGAMTPPPASAAQRVAFQIACPAVADRPYFLFLGRIHPKKGCDLLLEAFAGIASERPDFDLVFAGPGDAALIELLRSRGDEMGLAGRVHFPGMLLGDAKWGALRGATAFVLPSHQENFGVAVVEALATGCPVLISDKVNIWREIDAAAAGIVDEDNATGTERLLRRFLMLDPERLAQQRAAGRALFEERFTAAAAAASLMAVIEAELASRPRNGSAA